MIEILILIPSLVLLIFLNDKLSLLPPFMPVPSQLGPIKPRPIGPRFSNLELFRVAISGLVPTWPLRSEERALESPLRILVYKRYEFYKKIFSANFSDNVVSR